MYQYFFSKRKNKRRSYSLFLVALRSTFLGRVGENTPTGFDCSRAEQMADTLHQQIMPRFATSEACQDRMGSPCSAPRDGSRQWIPARVGFVISRPLDTEGNRAVFPVYRVNRPSPVCAPGAANCQEPPPPVWPGSQHLRPGYYSGQIYVGDLAPGVTRRIHGHPYTEGGLPFTVEVDLQDAVARRIAVMTRIRQSP